MIQVYSLPSFLISSLSPSLPHPFLSFSLSLDMVITKPKWYGS